MNRSTEGTADSVQSLTWIRRSDGNGEASMGIEDEGGSIWERSHKRSPVGIISASARPPAGPLVSAKMDQSESLRGPLEWKHSEVWDSTFGIVFGCRPEERVVVGWHPAEISKVS